MSSTATRSRGGRPSQQSDDEQQRSSHQEREGGEEDGGHEVPLRGSSSTISRAKALAVVFAVGAVSGTILSFEMGVLPPGLMGTYGEVIGLPLAIEGIAFFIEAIFLGIYLYGWGRFPPRVHLLTGVPIVLAGVTSAFFVVTANAWMQQPTGFRLADAERSSST